MEEQLRQKHNIPAHFAYCPGLEGKHYFSYCDADITVGPDGLASYSYMGFDSYSDSHKFITVPWR